MDDEKLLRNFTHITIPAEIWLRRDISMQAKALWAELRSLHSNEHGGCFASEEYLCEFLQLKRRRFYQILKELKNAGLMELVHFNGRQTIRRAIVPLVEYGKETPKSKKMHSRSAQKCTTDVHNPALAPYIENKEESIMSEPAFGLATFLFEKLKEINPKIRKPDLKKWTQEMNRLLFTDGRTDKEIKDVIDFLLIQHTNPKGDFTWSKAVASPQKLREHFARIWMDMQSTQPKNTPKQSSLSPEIESKRRQKAQNLENKNRDGLKRDLYVNAMNDHFRCGNDKLWYSDPKFDELLEHLIKKYQLKS
jgi:helix-turn-helix protein